MGGSANSKIHIDTSHEKYDIALVNEGEFIDLRYKEKVSPTAPMLIIVRFFPKTSEFRTMNDDSRLIDIGKEWLTRVDQSKLWMSICINLTIKLCQLRLFIDSLSACTREFVDYVDTSCIRRKIEDRLRDDPEFVNALALIMGIS